MRLSGLIASALTVAFLALPALAQAQDSPAGRWYTEGRKSQIEISPCDGTKLCGRIIWLNEPNDESGKPKTDVKNPLPPNRDKPIVGLALLAGFVKQPDGTWAEGTIYNPEDGETYKCIMTLEGQDTLKVRGYVGMPMLGKTQVWTRVK